MARKIALIAPTTLPSRRANTIQVMKMAQAIAQAGHEIQVVAPIKGGNARLPKWDDLSRHYGLATEFPVTWIPVSPAFRSYDFGLRAVRWARRWGADLVYTRHLQAAAVASLLGMPVILEIHDFPQGRMGPILFRLFLRGRGAWRLVSITEALSRDLKSSFSIPGPLLVTAPDGVDLARYEGLPEAGAARRALAQNIPDTFTIGYTGHLYPGRGAAHILEIAKAMPDAAFLLVGGNPEDISRVEAQAETKGLENMFLAGFIPNAELPRYQASCDVLLMPYQRRVAASSGGDIAKYLSPMKLFEYLACGRPILASDLAVFREVLNDKNAILLPPDDPALWVNALQNLRSDPEKRARLSEAARAAALQYSWSARVARVLE